MSAPVTAPSRTDRPHECAPRRARAQLRIAEYTEDQLLEAGFSSAAISLAGFGSVSWSFGAFTYASTLGADDGLWPAAVDSEVSSSSGGGASCSRAAGPSAPSGATRCSATAGARLELWDLPGMPAPAPAATTPAVAAPAPAPAAARGKGRFETKQISRPALAEHDTWPPGPSFDEWNEMLKAKAAGQEAHHVASADGDERSERHLRGLGGHVGGAGGVDAAASRRAP